MAVNCPLCNEAIADDQSKVCAAYDVTTVGNKHSMTVAYCHRKCAAEKWPEFYQWYPPPKR